MRFSLRGKAVAEAHIPFLFSFHNLLIGKQKSPLFAAVPKYEPARPICIGDCCAYTQYLSQTKYDGELTHGRYTNSPACQACAFYG